MSDIKLTPEQAEAVRQRGGALLVSAAAGSGKTRVLVERLMSYLDEGVDIDEFLIITYTNAAAAELRGKILDALYERAAAEPGDMRIRRQINLCGRAHIETIHSFCLGLIRENVSTLGLSPDVRVADETECSNLRRDVLEELIEEQYSTGEQSFRELADTMGAGKDDTTLVETVLDAHTKLMSHPDPVEWVDNQLKVLELEGVTDLAQTPWGRILMERAKRSVKWQEHRLSELMDEPEPFVKAYGPSLAATLNGLKQLREALDISWDEARRVEIPMPRPKGVSGFEEQKLVRKQCIEEIKKLSEFFYDDSDKALSDLRKTAPVVRAVLKLTLQFEECYSARKRRRNVLDFSDQEHLALRLLQDPEFSAETAGRFREIMVDEYQDVNAIQEAIFNAVSRDGKNIFMVGDVKQSIYRFRLADPGIFLHKYSSFRNAGEAGEGEPRKVVLSRNFRSRGDILDAVNYVFRNVMSPEFGDIAYSEREYLNAGAKYPESSEEAVELDVLDSGASADGDEAPGKTEYEALYAAGRILEMVGRYQISDGSGGQRPLRFGDIAVLMRSPKSREGEWTEVFARCGIPLTTGGRDNYFQEPEVSLMMSMLSIIDNPRQDIPLAAVLRSPIYGFTADELAGVRLSARDGDFYEALTAASETDEKSAAFLRELNELRDAAPELSAAELLWLVYTRTNLLALVSAMPGAAARRRNLMTLFEYARTYERTGFKGLYGFITYLHRVAEEGKGPEGSVTEAEDAVRLMSIHKSKGLEFPVVILADTTKRFNTDDTTKPLLIHPELGIGPKLVDTDRRIEYPTIARRAVREKLLEEGRSEELRLLYVALTRAQEKLIMLCTYANAERELKKITGIELPAPPEQLKNARCSAEWVLIPALRREEGSALRYGAANIPSGEGAKWKIQLVTAVPETRRPEDLAEKPETTDTEYLGELTKRLSFEYPYREATHISSKITATELKGTFESAEAAEEAQQLTEQYREESPVRPDFMEGRRGLTAAQRGTAVHVVMQYADYSHCLTQEGVRGEVEQLQARRILTKEQADAVQPDIISDFFHTMPGERIMNAEKVWRELKFSLLVDSSILGEAAGEQLLLQGVVDCCILRNGKLTIIDFKTDRVNRETADERAMYYKGQLKAYAMAMERILGLPVEEKLVCFLTSGIWRSIA